MSHSQITRRHFLARSAAIAGAGAAATPAAQGDTYVTRRQIVSSRRVRGANDRLSIACIGCGGRGTDLMGDLQRFSQSHNVEVTALCDTWRVNLAAAAAKVKEWYDREPRTSTRYQEILALPDIDGVIIATPDFAHSKILAAACLAGKDAYCEKPMASNLEDAVAALRAATEMQSVVQVGTQRRSDGQFMGGAELIQSGALGKITEVIAQWNDAGPRWARGYGDIKEEDVDWEAYLMGLEKRAFDPERFRRWHLFKEFTVGTPGLLGAHIIDIATWYMSDPIPHAAVSLGGVYIWKDGREHADTLTCLFEFPTEFLLTYRTRLGNSYMPAECVFHGIKGTFDTRTWKATSAGGGREKLTEEIAATPKPGVNHIANWLECMRSRAEPNAPIEAGYAHSVASIMAFRAWESGRRQVYDPERMEIRAG